jgi:hypothetical protein
MLAAPDPIPGLANRPWRIRLWFAFPADTCTKVLTSIKLVTDIQLFGAIHCGKTVGWLKADARDLQAL